MSSWALSDQGSPNTRVSALLARDGNISGGGGPRPWERCQWFDRNEGTSASVGAKANVRPSSAGTTCSLLLAACSLPLAPCSLLPVEDPTRPNHRITCSLLRWPGPERPSIIICRRLESEHLKRTAAAPAAAAASLSVDRCESTRTSTPQLDSNVSLWHIACASSAADPPQPSQSPPSSRRPAPS